MNITNSAKKVANNLKYFSLELADTNIDAGLSIAEEYGRFLSRNHIGILDDKEFELKFAEHFSHLLNSTVKQRTCGTLHLMTTSYVHGGHTRVVERFIKGGVGDGLAVLDTISEEVLNQIPSHITIFNGIRKPSGADTISALMNIGHKFEKIILHIHPEDIYSAITAILLTKLGVKVFLYNHADHLFSFGYAGAEKVFEISKYGWIQGAKRGIEHKQTFVGVPIPPLDLRNKYYDKNTSIQIFMAGNSNKFVPWAEYSVPEFINKFYSDGLMQNKVKFTICGTTGQEKYWRKLDKNIRHYVTFLGLQPLKKYMELLADSDCYVDSFPQGNGTAFVEAVMLGIPSFGLGLMSGYSYAETLKSQTISDLIITLTNHIKYRYAIDHKLIDVREKIITDQSISNCTDRLIISMEENKYIPLPEDLMSMKCMDNFYEQFWTFQADIHISFLFRRLFCLKASIRQRINLIKCTITAWPYAYRSFCNSSILLFRKLTH